MTTKLKIGALALSIAAAAWPAPAAAEKNRSTCTQVAVDPELEVRTFAATIAAETRGEKPEDASHVADTIGNRAMRLKGQVSPIMATLMQYRQYTPWNEGSEIKTTMIAAILGLPYDNPDFKRAFEQALPIARAVMAGKRSGDLPADALHFLNPETSDAALWQYKGRETYRFNGGRHIYIAGVVPPRFPSCPRLTW